MKPMQARQAHLCLALLAKLTLHNLTLVNIPLVNFNLTQVALFTLDLMTFSSTTVDVIYTTFVTVKRMKRSMSTLPVNLTRVSGLTKSASKETLRWSCVIKGDRMMLEFWNAVFMMSSFLDAEFWMAGLQ